MFAVRPRFFVVAALLSSCPSVDCGLLRPSRPSTSTSTPPSSSCSSSCFSALELLASCAKSGRSLSSTSEVNRQPQSSSAEQPAHPGPPPREDIKSNMNPTKLVSELIPIVHQARTSKRGERHQTKNLPTKSKEMNQGSGSSSSSAAAGAVGGVLGVQLEDGGSSQQVVEEQNLYGQRTLTAPSPPQHQHPQVEPAHPGDADVAEGVQLVAGVVAGPSTRTVARGRHRRTGSVAEVVAGGVEHGEHQSRVSTGTAATAVPPGVFTSSGSVLLGPGATANHMFAGASLTGSGPALMQTGPMIRHYQKYAASTSAAPSAPCPSPGGAGLVPALQATSGELRRSEDSEGSANNGGGALRLPAPTTSKKPFLTPTTRSPDTSSSQLMLERSGSSIVVEQEGSGSSIIVEQNASAAASTGGSEFLSADDSDPPVDAAAPPPEGFSISAALSQAFNLPYRYQAPAPPDQMQNFSAPYPMDRRGNEPFLTQGDARESEKTARRTWK